MNNKGKQIEICEKCKIKDTCSNRILVHLEKCKVNDCDYYCEATDREKQIEEMAEVINSPMLNYCKELNKCKEVCEYSRQYTCRDYAYATALYTAGYRQVKDKVVLDKEEREKGIIEREWMRENIDEILNENNKLKKELNDYKQRYESAEKRYEQLVQSSCEALAKKGKETAREYHEKMRKVIHERDYVSGYAEIGLQEENDELAKQYGVEVE